MSGPHPGEHTTGHEIDEVLLGFARALRAAGVGVTQDRSQGFLRAVALLGVGDRQATYWAGRTTLCGSPDDLDRYDQIFAAWFDPKGELPRARPRETPPPATVSLLPEAEGGGGGDSGEDEVLRAAASTQDVLAHRDVASMDAAEKRRLAAMFSRLSLRAPQRPTARHQAWHRGTLDGSRTLRNSLKHLGEPGELAWRRRGTRPRRVVLLIDISGSMSSYADALLRLAHRLSQSARSQGGIVETFTIGTRLTHVTRALRTPDPDRAIVAAGEVVPDWSGGTRLGETLRVFLDRWGQRGMARGSVVVLFSDGWERGDAALLGEQMSRLRRIAYRVAWVNPHRGKAGYEPVQGGVMAALPYCHDFLAGHSLATFAELTEVISRA